MHGHEQAKATLMSRLNNKTISTFTNHNRTWSYLLTFSQGLSSWTASFAVIRAISKHIKTLCLDHDRRLSKVIILQGKAGLHY